MSEISRKSISLKIVIQVWIRVLEPCYPDAGKGKLPRKEDFIHHEATSDRVSNAGEMGFPVTISVSTKLPK